MKYLKIGGEMGKILIMPDSCFVRYELGLFEIKKDKLEKIPVLSQFDEQGILDTSPLIGVKGFENPFLSDIKKMNLKNPEK